MFSSTILILIRLSKVFRLQSLLQSLLFFTLFLGNELFARAGGGGGYSSGSSSHYSSGSSSYGGSADPSGFVIVILVLFIVVFVISIIEQQVENRHKERLRRAFALQTELQYHENLEKLKKRDPLFNLETFKKRCEKPFKAIQYAWSAQDMSPVRAYISDGVYQRFKTQLAMDKSSGNQNIMENVTVIRVSLAGVESNEHYDVLHLEITARALDYTRYSNLGFDNEMYKKHTTFTEVWSFIRKPSVRTLSRPGVLEGYCPSCSAPLKISDSLQCNYCKALVNSGEYDWILSEITQVNNFMVIGNIGNLAAMKAKDPGLCEQQLEDNASVIYWKTQAAAYYANENILKKYALPRFMQENRSFFQANPNSLHYFLADAAVGSVNLLRFDLADTDNKMDRAHILIRASGHYEHRQVPGEYPHQYDLSNYIDDVYILARKPGVKSAVDKGLTSLRCLNCGGPEKIDNSGNCSYCNAVQNDGSLSWVLEEIHEYNEKKYMKLASHKKESTPLLPSMNYLQKEHLLTLLIVTLLEDKRIHKEEQDLLIVMCEKLGITSKRMDEMVLMQYAHKQNPSEIFQDDTSKKEFLSHLIDACLIDGYVSKLEREVLIRVAKKLDFSVAQLKTLIKKERQSLLERVNDLL